MNPRNIPTSDSDLHWPVTLTVTPPALGTVQVWCSILRCEADVLSRLGALLSTDETERASRFRTDELRNRYVVSRGVMRSILGAQIGVPPHEVPLEIGVNGKPHLGGKSELQLNPAHTGDLMLLAVTHGLRVGVDVERIRPMKDAQSIARRFFTAREADWVDAVKEAQRDQRFFNLWTRKEAVLKATGEGISKGLNHWELMNSESELCESVVRTGEHTSEDGWRLQKLDPASGFIGALALPENAGQPLLKTATYQPA